MLQGISDNFCVVAAQLVEAACCARDGESEKAKAYIAHAMALLKGEPSSVPASPRAFRERQLARGGLAGWQARRLIAYVDSNLGGRIRVEELAAVVELSTSHFCRAFKCTFSVSAHDYVMRRRIEVAQGLMLTTGDSLSAIALSCGMSDQSHFTRSFRRIVGQTPYSWRRTRRDALEEKETRVPRIPLGPRGRSSAARLTSIAAHGERSEQICTTAPSLYKNA